MKYYAIGFTMAEITAGASEVFHGYEVKKSLMEIRSLSPFETNNYEGFVKRFGKEYFTVTFLNEVAKAVCDASGIALPPVIAELDESELPGDAGWFLRQTYAEMVQKS